MTGRPSSATERALKRVAKGESAYAAAKAEGIALSTIYRALKRLNAPKELHKEVREMARQLAKIKEAK